MRQLMLAVGVLCVAGVFTGQATSQNAAMPGQTVGEGVTYNFNPVGTQVPKAAPAAGKPINVPADSPLMRHYDPTRPYDAFKGTSLSPSQLVAPITGAGDQSTLHQWYSKLKTVVGLGPPPQSTQPANSTYFPSLTRRNRERAENRLWRRD